MTSTNIYTDLTFDGTNHFYSLPRFQNNDSSIGCKPASKITSLKCNKFGLKKKFFIMVLLGVMFVVLLLSACSLYAGYKLGKHNCGRQSFGHKPENTEVSTEQQSSGDRSTEGPNVQTTTVLAPSPLMPSATTQGLWYNSFLVVYAYILGMFCGSSRAMVIFWIYTELCINQ